MVERDPAHPRKDGESAVNEPAVTFDENVLNEFWMFVRERHSVFEKRFLQGQPPPWTEDPILRQYKFTNVFRELDRGTVWVQKQVLERDLTHEEKVYWVMAYRMGIQTWVFDKFWASCGQSLTERNVNAFYGFLRSNALMGKPIWTDAYTVCPVKFYDKDLKVDNLGYLLIDLYQKWIEQLVDELRKAPNLKAAHRVIRTIPGFADFLAYEVVCDLMYAGGLLWEKGFTENDWVNAGPGCRRGLKAMVVENTGITWEEMIEFLRAEQDDYCRQYGLEPIRWAGKPLSLRNVEHSLCEFSKYIRLKQGKGTTRRFKQTGEPLWL